MFKLACFVFVAAVVANCNAAYTQSASSNSGLNVASTNSHVAQNNIQNAASQGYGGAYPYALPGGYYPGGPAQLAPAPYLAPYGLDATAYGYGGPAVYPYGGGAASVNSQSSNQGANILSSDSTVVQNNVQNAQALHY